MSNIISTGKEFKYETVEITVEQFARLKSFRDQLDTTDGGSVSKVNPKRVAQIEVTLWPALTAPHNVPLLNKQGDVLQGNHRLVATKRNQMLPNRINPKAVFKINRLIEETTPSEDSELAIRGNLDTHTTGYRDHLLDSHHDVSVKLMQPVRAAMRLVWPNCPDGIINQIVPRLGTYLNRNPGIVRNLGSGHIPCTAYDLAELMRRHPEAGKNFVSATVAVDLRGKETLIAHHIRVGLETMKDLVEDGTWAEKFGRRKTNMSYVLIAMAMRGDIVDTKRAKGVATRRKVKTVICNKLLKISNQLKNFNNLSAAQKAEDTILVIFQEDMDRSGNSYSEAEA